MYIHNKYFTQVATLFRFKTKFFSSIYRDWPLYTDYRFASCITSGFCECSVEKTVITRPPSDSLVRAGHRTATLHCSAVTDPLTPLTIQWIAGNNASDDCATWRTVDAHHQQVLVELNQSHVCCEVTCSASNGLSQDSSSARVCWAKATRIPFTEHRRGSVVLVTPVATTHVLARKKCLFRQKAIK